MGPGFTRTWDLLSPGLFSAQGLWPAGVLPDSFKGAAAAHRDAEPYAQCLIRASVLVLSCQFGPLLQLMWHPVDF